MDISKYMDGSGMMGQFILSGSQNFHLMHSISQTLAGRVALLKLFPFDNQELSAAGWLPDDYLDILVKGYYPAIYDRNIEPRTYYDSYIQTYIHRDVSDMIAIRDLNSFRRFIAMCAARAGKLLNMSALANECGISQPTAKAWLSALESSYIVFLLYPFHKNLSKRIIKTPKLYFYDTGLLCHLIKISHKRQIMNQSVKGTLFENMVIADYVKRKFHKNEILDEVWFWRDVSGNEVDLLIQKPMMQEIVEIKASATVMPDMFKGLNYFSSHEQDVKLKKKLVYGGNETQIRSAAEVVPWYAFGK